MLRVVVLAPHAGAIRRDSQGLVEAVVGGIPNRKNIREHAGLRRDARARQARSVIGAGLEHAALAELRGGNGRRMMGKIIDHLKKANINEDDYNQSRTDKYL